MSPLESWVDAANQPHTDFPLENLPFGVFTRADSHREPAIGVAIGDHVLDLRACREAGLLDPLPVAVAAACTPGSLNALMAIGRRGVSLLRARLQAILSRDPSASGADRQRADACLLPMSAVVMQVPAAIGDFTDFYASIHHATHVGQLFRPDRQLPPNYFHLPLAYHGRASSIVVSGSPIRRPLGQSRAPGAQRPEYGPTASLDYEVEVGFFIGEGNAPGDTIALSQAESAIFGVCLVNDWSARDLQAWEAQPLGPFLSKNFATTISPWVVSMDALEPFRTPSVVRSAADPAPLAYLASSDNQARGGLDVTLEVSLVSSRMRAEEIAPMRLGRSEFRDGYWNAAQLVTHHASNGCQLRPGDLLASGTVSGPGPDARGCLLELTRRGTEAVVLPTGERRTYLEDGDEVIVRGYCEREGHTRIGLGECRGLIVEARPPSQP